MVHRSLHFRTCFHFLSYFMFPDCTNAEHVPQTVPTHEGAEMRCEEDRTIEVMIFETQRFFFLLVYAVNFLILPPRLRTFSCSSRRCLPPP